jgi:hypothetical protein
MSSIRRIVTAAFAGAFVLAACTPARAQVDLSGSWANKSHEDWMERWPGPDPVDYLGLPLNDDARAKALAYDYSSRLGEAENQCGYYTPFYIVLGPFGLKIWSESDPTTGNVVAWKLGGWIDRDLTTIWMDGRPHPPANAFHSYSGFTTGVWEGDTLTTYTTHIREGILRRNGVPSSDRATMTQHIVRHGELLTITARFEDPVYLTEPQVVSRVWHLDPHANYPATASACEPISEVPRLESSGVVPHFLPGKNPFVNELTQMYHIPLEAVLGHAETMYPEYRKTLQSTYQRPALCARYCCGLGSVSGCITDGSGKPRP